MKNFLTLVLALISLQSAQALPNFDPFAGTPGSNLIGMTDSSGTNTWNGVSTDTNGPQPVIVSGSLSYPDLAAPTGNGVSFTNGPGKGARVTVASGALPVVYYSLLLNVTDLSAVPTTNTNNYIVAFNDATAAQAQNVSRAGARLVSKRSGTGYQLGIALNGVTSEFVYAPDVLNTNDTVFVVASYERNGVTTNANLWVNPPSASFGATTPPTPSAGLTNSTVNSSCLNGNGARAFLIACINSTAPAGIIDEVRVGDNWSFITGGEKIIVTSQPDSRTVLTNSKVTFAVSISGPSPNYQWRRNGNDISGATSFFLTISNAQTSDEGSYTVVITNSASAVTSSVGVLTLVSNVQLYNTNLVAVRIGDGAQTLTTGGNSIFLDQFTPSGSYINTISIPDSGSSGLIQSGPDVTGNVITGTSLTRSGDKKFLVLAGYRTDIGNINALHNTSAATVPRGIGLIDAQGQYTLALTDTTAYSAAHWRAAAFDGAGNFWGAGSAGGTYYFGTNAPATTNQTDFANNRTVGIFNGDLYTAGNNGFVKFTGLPTNAVSVTNYFGGSATVTDFAVSPTGTPVYLTVGNNVQRWDLDGGTWTNSYSFFLGSTARYVTADFGGANPAIFADNETGQVLKIVDTGAGSSPAVIATSGVNQIYKGLRFGPAIVVPNLSFALQGGNLILTWPGSFILQSATNVAGTYNDVSGAMSPHTNTIVSGTEQRFFRLRN